MTSSAWSSMTQRLRYLVVADFSPASSLYITTKTNDVSKIDMLIIYTRQLDSGVTILTIHINVTEIMCKRLSPRHHFSTDAIFGGSFRW